MDRESALKIAEHTGAALTCHQAVFTSIPSPLGRGYRLVAASPGLTADEKREIVQRAPSHNNLCDSGDDAAGLAVFPMSGGRICILVSWHCELEHSGRGGHRVHTHALLLHPADYRQAGYNPFTIEAACRVAASNSIPANNVTLPQLQLDLSASGPAFAAARGAIRSVPQALEVAARAADAVFSNRKLVISNAPQPRTLIQLLHCFLPQPLLAKLSFSIGMRFSPVRDFNLICADLRRDEFERIVDEYRYEVLDWSAVTPRPPGQYDQWLALMARAVSLGDQKELMRAVASIQDADWKNSIAQILRLDADIARIATANEKLLEEICAAHRPFTRKNDLQTNLHLKLLSTAAQRRAELEAATATPQPA